MTVQIKYATEADVADIATLNVKSFLHTQMYNNAFPNASFDSLFAYKQARAFEKLAGGQHIAVGIDPATANVVACARWVIPPALGYGDTAVELSDTAAAAGQNPGLFAPKEMNHAVMKGFMGLLYGKRAVYVEDKDIGTKAVPFHTRSRTRPFTHKPDAVLEFLATLPEHQGKGIGTQMLQWGMDKADAANARIYLEATADGCPLYLKNGFRVVDEVVLDYAEFGGQQSQTFTLMVRDRKPQP